MSLGRERASSRKEVFRLLQLNAGRRDSLVNLDRRLPPVCAEEMEPHLVGARPWTAPRVPLVSRGKRDDRTFQFRLSDCVISPQG